MTSTVAVRSVAARELFDSRGVATIEVDVRAGSGRGRSAAPFGAPGSRGEFEASAYGTLGVTQAVRMVETELARRLVGMDATDLVACDAVLHELDGTPNFARIGGNTSSAVSIAVATAAADALDVPLYTLVGSPSQLPTLPIPLGNIIGGGAHALGPTPDMQEHLLLPVSARTIREAVELNIRAHEETGRILANRDSAFTGGCDDERGWAANLDDVEALEVLTETGLTVEAETGDRFRLGLDLAADRFWDRDAGVYRYHRSGLVLSPAEQVDFVESLARRFRLAYIEDAFESTDYESFAELRRRIGDGCLVCGDDLLVTNSERLAHGVAVGSVNAMTIKVNQVGTVTDAGHTNERAHANGVTTVMSHRSGETEDAAIAHFGVAWGCPLIKTGVLGGERLAKLNELIRIEDAADRQAHLAPLPAPLAITQDPAQ